MLIGHYAPALAIKRIAPRAPVWALFVAVQIMDVFWAMFVGLGVERAHIDPSRTAMPLVLDYMPFSHSLVGAIGLSFAFAALVSAFIKPPRARALFWLALAGVSHWVLDLLVHFPDLTLFGTAPYLGFALWRYPWFEFGLEIVLLSAAMAYYVAGSTPRARTGRIAPWAVVGLLSAVFYGSKVVPPGDPSKGAGMAIACYAVFALLGFWLDRTRVMKALVPPAARSADGTTTNIPATGHPA